MLLKMENSNMANTKLEKCVSINCRHALPVTSGCAIKVDQTIWIIEFVTLTSAAHVVACVLEYYYEKSSE